MGGRSIGPLVTGMAAEFGNAELNREISRINATYRDNRPFEPEKPSIGDLMGCTAARRAREREENERRARERAESAEKAKRRAQVPDSGKGR